MGTFIDMTGQRFGRLTVTERASNNKHNCVMWLCRCDCGKDVAVLGSSLRNGSTRSCGCYSAELTRERGTTHGMCKSRLYRIWDAMKQRCYATSHKAFENYGGRGITVCNAWRESFEAFRDWALSAGYNDDLTLDRMDTDGNYEPSNCQWVSLKDQQSNKRNNRLISYAGKTLTVSEWAEVTGINRSTLFARIRLGWPCEKIIETPPAIKYRPRGD